MLEAADLTTHGVIVGMTGSGKTGLAVVLIEEALLAGIPTLIIDPKGDLGNLLLTFPELKPDDFAPWVESGDPADVAKEWSDGLADWGIEPGRIGQLRDAAEFTIYTPGSTSGVPLDVVGGLDRPAEGADAETVADEVEGYVSGLLTMVGIEADPLASKEHILLSNLSTMPGRPDRTSTSPALSARCRIRRYASSGSTSSTRSIRPRIARSWPSRSTDCSRRPASPPGPKDQRHRSRPPAPGAGRRPSRLRRRVAVPPVGRGAPADGTVLAHNFTEGSLAPVSAVLGVIGAAGESADAAAPSTAEVKPVAPSDHDQSHANVPPPVAPSQAQVESATAGNGAQGQPGADGTAGEDVKASPVAKRVAADKGVPLGSVSGTGPGGQITKSDVLAYAVKGPGEAAAASVRGPAVAPPALPGDLADEATLVVRRAAADLNINLAEIAGGRPFSTLTKYDVLSAAASRAEGKDVKVQPAFPSPTSAPRCPSSRTIAGTCRSGPCCTQTCARRLPGADRRPETGRGTGQALTHACGYRQKHRCLGFHRPSCHHDVGRRRLGCAGPPRRA